MTRLGKLPTSGDMNMRSSYALQRSTPRPPRKGSFPHFHELITIVACLLGFCVTAGSSSPKVSADISVRNQSTNHLDWVSIEWGAGRIQVGVMPPGKGATYFDFGLPANVQTNVAFFKFINEDTSGLDWKSGSNEEVRARRATSWTRVPIDVSRLLHLGKEHHYVTFRLLSLTNADVEVVKVSKK